MLKPTSSFPSDGSGVTRFLICDRDLANAIPPARASYRFELNVVLIVSGFPLFVSVVLVCIYSKCDSLWIVS
jgi:hypothetical protein